jgi:hypothetical protein
MVTRKPILDSYEAYGVKRNDIDVVELFGRYSDAGFLSMDKLEHLVPHIPKVLDNWKRAMRADPPLMEVISHEDAPKGSFASISRWQTTNGGGHSQHLISYGNPLGTRAVMLARQAVGINERGRRAEQAWFQPSNRFSNRVFGAVVSAVGPELGCVRTSSFMVLPVHETNWKSAAPPPRTALRVERVKNGQGEGLGEFAARHAGAIWAQAEELSEDDHELDAIDQQYQRVGLRRYRRAFIAYRSGSSSPVAVALVYRGPMGFNFSFVENRCELIVPPELPEREATDAIAALLAEAVDEYRDFEAGCIPLVVDDRLASVANALLGARIFRRYSQAIWLSGGFTPMYRHLERFYDKLQPAGDRRGLDAATWRNRSQIVRPEGSPSLAPKR